MTLNTDLHRTILFRIIKDIFNNDIGKYLAFKGGTACYFLHNLDRFSTDLDFDLIHNEQNIDNEVENIAKKYGTVKKGNKLIISYGEHDVNIKIDINRKVWKNNEYEIINFYGTDIKVQKKGTIFANKLIAMTERHTNRDIYDIYFFFSNNFEINEKIIYERSKKTTLEILQEIKKKLLSLPKNYKILDGLGEVLDEKQKKFVKTGLIKELLAIIEMKIDFLNRHQRLTLSKNTQ